MKEKNIYPLCRKCDTLLFYNYESKNGSPSNLAFQACCVFIGTQIEKDFLNVVSPLRKSTVSTLTDLNPGRIEKLPKWNFWTRG